MSEVVIKVDKVCKSFKEGKVLSNVSIEFERGKIHGLVGRNGSGKTMLLKCICGFVPVTSGEIQVKGKRVGKDIDIPKDVGIIIEAPGFLPNYSGFRNLKFLSSITNKISDDDIKDTISLVGLDPASKKWVGKYSLGMRQRLGLAQALMEKPSILILDEPMNGLDTSGVDDVRRILMEYREQGNTIIIATHNMEDVGMLCDTVSRMEAGVLTVEKSELKN